MVVDLHDHDPGSADATVPDERDSSGGDGLDRALRALYSVAIASLWWRTLILTIVSAALGWLSLWLPDQGPDAARWSGLAEEISGGLFMAGLGAAIVQALVMSAPGRFRNLTAARMAEQRTAELRSLEQRMESLGKLLGDQMSRLSQRLSQVEEVERELQSRVHRADTLDSAGIVRLYARRSDAYVDMSRALRDPATTNIGLLGVRLAHMVRSNVGPSPWHSLESELRARVSSGGNLAVRVLLMDPACTAARLLDRSGTGDQHLGSLDLEVRLTLDSIRQLRRQLPRNSGVSLDVALYRTAPQSFVLLTDNEVYLQPYTYSNVTRRESSDTPRTSDCVALFMYERWSLVHSAAREHFDVIWSNAVGYDELYERASIGVDRGLADSGIVNVYTDPQSALRRMVHLIRSARERVWIQGLSLNPMFARELDEAMNELVQRRDIPDVRLLILDPQCEQARLKSYREYVSRHALSDDPPELERYLREGDEFHQNSKIYQAIMGNMQRLRELLRGTGVGGAPSHVKVRCYSSAPVAYVLIADGHALVEQYHFGKQGFSLWSAELQLTEEMPLLEYRRVSRQTPPHPFAIIEDHYEHVFDRVASPIQQ